MSEKQKLFLPTLIAVLIIVVGGIIALLPIFFWDFLVTYQFRPTVRPYYPVFYGSIFTTGVVIIVLGIIGLKKRGEAAEASKKKPWMQSILPLLCLIIAIALPIAIGTVFSTTL